MPLQVMPLRVMPLRVMDVAHRIVHSAPVAPPSLASEATLMLPPTGDAMWHSPFAPITLGPVGLTSRDPDARDRRWAGSAISSTRSSRPSMTTPPREVGTDLDDPVVLASGDGGDGNNSLIAPLSGGYDIGTEQVPSFLDEPMEEDNSNTIVVPLPTPVLLTGLGLAFAIALRSTLRRSSLRPIA
jgi:hypothetical protein